MTLLAERVCSGVGVQRQSEDLYITEVSSDSKSQAPTDRYNRSNAGAGELEHHNFFHLLHLLQSIQITSFSPTSKTLGLWIKSK